MDEEAIFWAVLAAMLAIEALLLWFMFGWRPLRFTHVEALDGPKEKP